MRAPAARLPPSHFSLTPLLGQRAKRAALETRASPLSLSFCFPLSLSLTSECERLRRACPPPTFHSHPCWGSLLRSLPWKLARRRACCAHRPFLLLFLFSFSFSFSFPFPFPFPSSLLSHLIINHDACLRAPRAATRTSRVAGSSHTVSQCEKSARYARTHQLTINERLHAFHEFKTKLEILSAPCFSASSGLA